MQPRRVWIVTALTAVVSLLLWVMVSDRPWWRERSAPSRGTSAADSLPRAMDPHSVIAIQVDVENALRPIDVTPPPEPEPAPPPPPPTEAPDTGETDESLDGLASLDLDGADAQRPPAANRGGSSSQTNIILPRPVEITWPETSRLKPCIGLHLNVDVRVGEDGRVLRVDPVDKNFPEECLRSAVNAAAQIRFVPGTVDGVPTTLSTRIRIDFEKRK